MVASFKQFRKALEDSNGNLKVAIEKLRLKEFIENEEVKRLEKRLISIKDKQNIQQPQKPTIR